MMQISLVQTEIEQALVDFANSQIKVKEGMQIKVTMKATRGDEGFTATIDIVPVDTVEQTPSLVRTAPAGIKAAVTAAKTSTKAETSPAKTPEPDPVVVVAADPSTAQQGQIADPQTDAPDPVPETIVEQKVVNGPDEPVAAAAPARSLFANLKKPVNQ